MRFGILLQGGFVPRYSLESCRRYRSTYPDLPIVLSTWNEDLVSSLTDLLHLRELGVEVVFSEKPETLGSQNTNLQIVSTRAGLAALAQLGVTHAMKSRTDVRCEADLVGLLARLRESYPPRAGYPQAERIVIAQSYTRIGMPYHASDMVMLGWLSDLRSYFDVPLRTADDMTLENWKRLSFHERLFSEVGVRAHVEQYLCLSYLRSIGWEARFTIKDWHDALAALFCVVDDRQLGFTWLKNPEVLGAAQRFDSDFLVKRSRYPGLFTLRAHSSLLCRRVDHARWLRILGGERSRLDADRLSGLLWPSNAIAFVRDIPRWLAGEKRRN